MLDERKGDRAAGVAGAGVSCWLGALTLLVSGCGIQPTSGPASEPDVLASVINVTPFEVTVVVSGVLDDAVDTVRRTVGPSDSTDVPFICIDELVVGDPIEPTTAGVTIDVDDEMVEFDAFSVLAGDSFFCGDVVEIIVSGSDAETFAVDVFAFTPP